MRPGKKALKTLRDPNFWVIVAMLVFCIILHYGSHMDFIAGVSGTMLPDLSRHTMDRILFLLPACYAAFVFGPAKGFITLSIATAIMLPQAIFISPLMVDALVEIASVVLVGGLIIMWFESLEEERSRRVKAIMNLETAQQQLQSQVKIVEQDKKRLAALSTISTIVTQSLELELILQRALDKVIELMQVDAAFAFLLDEEQQEIVLAASQGVSKEFTDGVARMKVGEGFNGRVALTGEPMVIADSSMDPKLTRMVVKTEKLQSQLIVPLKSKGKILGTLCLAKRDIRQFLPEEIALFSDIANHIGVAVENARLYEQSQVIAKQLRVSEKNYRELFENASDAIWVQDMKGIIIAANKASAQLGEYTQAEMGNVDSRSFLPGESIEIAREVRHKLLKGEPLEQPYEQPMVVKDGSEKIVKLTASLLMSDGQPTGFQLIGRDVTEEKKMRDNLRYYIQEFTRAQEKERKRISRELHDETSQGLIALSRQLDALIDGDGQLPPATIERLNSLRNLVDSLQEGVRRFSQDLRPSVLDDLGLVPAIEWFISQLSGYSGITTDFKVIGERRRLPREAELSLFRVAQEALGNVWRHSAASQARVTIEFSSDNVRLVIKDNGKGFKLPKRVGDLAGTGKLGLIGMSERLQLSHGTLNAESSPGKGTTITVTVPE